MCSPQEMAVDSKKEFFLLLTSAARKAAEAAWLAGSQYTAGSPSQGEVARQLADDLRVQAADYRSRGDLIAADDYAAINPAWGQPSENWEVADRLTEAAEGFAALAREWEVREASQLEARASRLEAAVDAERRLGGEEAGHYPDLRTFEAEDCRRRAAALRART